MLWFRYLRVVRPLRRPPAGLRAVSRAPPRALVGLDEARAFVRPPRAGLAFAAARFGAGARFLAGARFGAVARAVGPRRPLAALRTGFDCPALRGRVAVGSSNSASSGSASASPPEGTRPMSFFVSLPSSSSSCSRMGISIVSSIVVRSNRHERLLCCPRRELASATAFRAAWRISANKLILLTLEPAGRAPLFCRNRDHASV